MKEESKLILDVRSLVIGYDYIISTKMDFTNGIVLVVTNDRLDINYPKSTRFSFLKEDVISIEPFKLFEFSMFEGIKINHKIKNYPPYLVFYFSDSSNSILNKIKSTGFLDQKSSVVSQDIIDDVRKNQNKKPSYLHWCIGIVVLLIVVTYLVIIDNLYFSNYTQFQFFLREFF